MGSTDHADDFSALRALLPEVRQYIRQHAPVNWPDLQKYVLSSLIEEALGPLAALPLASAAAVGGDMREAIPVAAAWEVLSLSARTLDDLEDQDRPDALWSEVGLSRAFNFSATLYAFSGKLLAVAPWPAEKYRRISLTFIEESLHLAAGQDRDCCSKTRTLEEYWHTIEEKNASAFALACAAGAQCGTLDSELVNSCRTFGYHLGLAHQLFDDFEGIWESKDLGDLELGKITLPLIYGLSIDHKDRDELYKLISDSNRIQSAERIRTILDGIHARDFVIWSALQERDLAIAALKDCPGKLGVEALTAYVTMLFAHIESILV